MSEASKLEPQSYWLINADLKARWLEALRSGKFLQGTEALRAKPSSGCETYCCLGVLCEVYDPNGWDSCESWTYDGIDESGELPDNFRKSIVNMDPLAEAELIRMNDGGKSFPEIADWIEGNM